MMDAASEAEEGRSAGVAGEARGTEATPAGLGFAWAMLTFNTIVIGIVAMAFASGPYSSQGEALWYRYGSLAFLGSGALLPALALSLGAHRRPGMSVALAVWMAVTFVGFACYAIVSGGGHASS